MKVWITRWALTSGIIVGEAREANAGSHAIVHFGENRGDCFRPGEWHLTRDEAVEHAKTLQWRGLASARRRVAKLEAMTFEDTP